MSGNDTHVCECGHPINTHPGADYGRGSCVATVLTNAPLGGGSTYQCPCKIYSEAGGNMHADTLITYAEHLRLTEALAAEVNRERTRAAHLEIARDESREKAQTLRKSLDLNDEMLQQERAHVTELKQVLRHIDAVAEMEPAHCDYKIRRAVRAALKESS